MKGTDHSARPALWMLTGSVAFAAMGAFTHALGPRCDWLMVAFVRVAVMFVTTAAMARAADVRLTLFDPPTLWMRSLAGSFSLVCNFYALARLPVADAVTLSNIYPLWIVLATALWLRQPPTLGEVLGVASGLLGVALIQRPHLHGDALAIVVALLGTFGTTVAMFGLHRLRRVDPRAIVAHFAGVASIVSATILIFKPRALSRGVFDTQTLILLASVGLSGTIGQFFLTRAYAAGPPTRVAVVGLSQVVFAMILDVVIWHRPLNDPLTLAGFVLVLAPIGWLSGRAGRRLSELGRRSDVPLNSAGHAADVMVRRQEEVGRPEGGTMP